MSPRLTRAASKRRASGCGGSATYSGPIGPSQIGGFRRSISAKTGQRVVTAREVTGAQAADHLVAPGEDQWLFTDKYFPIMVDSGNTIRNWENEMKIEAQKVKMKMPQRFHYDGDPKFAEDVKAALLEKTKKTYIFKDTSFNFE